MEPIRSLLSRIKWDTEFGKGTFALGYFDRITGQERIIALASVGMDPDRRGLSVRDENGFVAHIPLHRVRTVYKDGVMIWQRPIRPAGPPRRAGVARGRPAKERSTHS